MLSNKVLLSALFAVGVFTVNAQTSTNSPYTRYGLGDLSDPAFTNNAAMGGIGYGLRNNKHINTMNPASYSAVDSLSFMFDLGMSLKSSDFKENGVKTNAKNSSFDYIAMQFRLHPRLGVAVGFTPYSTVGYNFSNSQHIEGSENTTSTSVFTGDGGLQQIFGGLGFKILENLSVGANIGYLYGNIDYQTQIGFNTTADYTITYNKIKVNSFLADFGVQYTQKISKDDNLTLGLTYGLGHDLNSTEEKGIQKADNAGAIIENNQKIIEDSYGIPHTIGMGVAYNRKQNLTVGIDYTLQKWADTKYNNQTEAYKNSSKIAIGTEFLPNPISRNYLKRIYYRAGAYYSTPYLKFGEVNGPSEYGISAGFGFPLYLFQKRTILNITGQYIHVDPSVSHMLSENRFVIKLGLTFNERWFMKWKVN